MSSLKRTTSTYPIITPSDPQGASSPTSSLSERAQSALRTSGALRLNSLSLGPAAAGPAPSPSPRFKPAARSIPTNSANQDATTQRWRAEATHQSGINREQQAFIAHTAKLKELLAKGTITKTSPRTTFITTEKERTEFSKIAEETLDFSETLYGFSRETVTDCMNTYATLERLVAKAPLQSFGTPPERNSNEEDRKKMESVNDQIFGNFEKFLYPNVYGNKESARSPLTEKELQTTFFNLFITIIIENPKSYSKFDHPQLMYNFVANAFYDSLHEFWNELEISGKQSDFPTAFKEVFRILVTKVGDYKKEKLVIDSQELLEAIFGKAVGGKGSLPPSIEKNTDLFKTVNQWKSQPPETRPPLEIPIEAIAYVEKFTLGRIFREMWENQDFKRVFEEYWNSQKDFIPISSPSPVPSSTSGRKSILKNSSPTAALAKKSDSSPTSQGSLFKGFFEILKEELLLSDQERFKSNIEASFNLALKSMSKNSKTIDFQTALQGYFSLYHMGRFKKNLENACTTPAFEKEFKAYCETLSESPLSNPIDSFREIFSPTSPPVLRASSQSFSFPAPAARRELSSIQERKD